MALKINVAQRLQQRQNEIELQKQISSSEENHNVTLEHGLSYESSGEEFTLTAEQKRKVGDFTVYDDYPMDTDEYIDKKDNADYDEYVRQKQAEAVNYYGSRTSEADTGTDILKRFKVTSWTQNEKLSRYAKSYRLLNKDDEQYIETYEGHSIPVSPDDTYHIVTARDKNRLDLISFQYYKTPLLWWVIAEASDIIDPFDVPVNSVLRVPSMSSLYSYGGIVY